MVTVTLYEPQYGTGEARGRRIYDAVGRLNSSGARSTLTEEGGEVEVGRESLRLTYLDPRVKSGWFAQLWGRWFRVTGARSVPPRGVKGDIELEPHTPVTIVRPPDEHHDLLWGADTPITWGGDSPLDWPVI